VQTIHPFYSVILNESVTKGNNAYKSRKFRETIEDYDAIFISATKVVALFQAILCLIYENFQEAIHFYLILAMVPQIIKCIIHLIDET